jgi:hypothetical protein
MMRCSCGEVFNSHRLHSLGACCNHGGAAAQPAPSPICI